MSSFGSHRFHKSDSSGLISNDNDSESVTSGNHDFKGQLDGNQVGHIHYSGYLLKKTDGAGEWHRRYFETNGTYLTYYKSNKMKKLLAAVNLPDVGEISYVGEVQGVDGSVFKMEIKDRAYMLAADNAAEAQRWLSVLRLLRDKGPNDNLVEHVATAAELQSGTVDPDTERLDAQLLNGVSSNKCCLIC